MKFDRNSGVGDILAYLQQIDNEMLGELRLQCSYYRNGSECCAIECEEADIRRFIGKCVDLFLTRYEPREDECMVVWAYADSGYVETPCLDCDILFMWNGETQLSIDYDSVVRFIAYRKEYAEQAQMEYDSAYWDYVDRECHAQIDERAF